MKNLRDMRVLVIGGLGFIGVNVSAKLAAEGARVAVMTPNRGKHAEDAATFERDGIEVIEGDLRDQAAMEKHVAGRQVILNLSGQSGAVRSMEDPWTDLDVNLRGNLVLLEALRAKNRDAKVVFAGSRLQYGHVDQVPAGEDTPQEALCLHAIHKQTVEKYLDLYQRLFGIRYTVARITNPYGPGQPSSRTAYGVINLMIHLAIDDRPITIYGDGTQLRDYVHVNDVVSALMAMAASPAADGEAFNVGSGTGTKLIDLATQVIAIAGGGRVTQVPWPALAAQVETGDFIADVTKIGHAFGWHPTINLAAGLEQSVAFYRRHGVS